MAHRRPDGSGDGGLVIRCRFPPPGHALRATRDAFGRRAETDRFAWLSGTLKVRPRNWRLVRQGWLGPVRPLPARAGVWPTGGLESVFRFLQTEERPIHALGKRRSFGGSRYPSARSAPAPE